jgi:high affinity Mn2+ porin
MEWDITKARGLVAEFEGRFEVGGRKVSARLLGFLNDARMGSYRQALEQPAGQLDVAATRALGRTKAGLAGSVNFEWRPGLSGFVRASFNDGKNETWAFTEIDRSLAFGMVHTGALWGRPDDEVGGAVVVSGLSNQHKRYLEGGGYGFLIGDGALHYSSEVLGEAYYRAAITREVSASVHVQPIVNPAFNADRGPIQVFTGRLHVAF